MIYKNTEKKGITMSMIEEKQRKGTIKMPNFYQNLKKMTLLSAIFSGVFMANAGDEPTAWPWSKYGIEQTDNPCAIPTPYTDKGKLAQYAQLKKIDFSGWGRNVIFLGDSIMNGWRPAGNGVKVLKEYSEKYPMVQPLNLFAMSGDEPQNTLWLITEGDILQSLQSPKVIVLMIGVNSLNLKKTPEQVAGGIKAIITYLRANRPDTKILLFGILPCWGGKAPVLEEIKKTNQIICKYADNKDVFFLDFGDKLLTADGNINPELSYDAIHLTEKGHELWAKIMFPYLDDLVKTGGNGEIWKTSAK